MSEKMKNRVKIQDVRFVEASGKKGFYLVHEEDPIFKDWYAELGALREQAIAEHRCNSRGYVYYG